MAALLRGSGHVPVVTHYSLVPAQCQRPRDVWDPGLPQKVPLRLLRTMLAVGFQGHPDRAEEAPSVPVPHVLILVGLGFLDAFPCPLWRWPVSPPCPVLSMHPVIWWMPWDHPWLHRTVLIRHGVWSFPPAGGCWWRLPQWGLGQQTCRPSGLQLPQTLGWLLGGSGEAPHSRSGLQPG